MGIGNLNPGCNCCGPPIVAECDNCQDRNSPNSFLLRIPDITLGWSAASCPVTLVDAYSVHRVGPCEYTLDIDPPSGLGDCTLFVSLGSRTVGMATEYYTQARFFYRRNEGSSLPLCSWTVTWEKVWGETKPDCINFLDVQLDFVSLVYHTESTCSASCRWDNPGPPAAVFLDAE